MSTSNIILLFMIIICLFNQSGSVVCFLFSVALSLYSSISVLLHVVLLSLISNSNTLFLATSCAFIASMNVTLPFATSYSSSSSSLLPPPFHISSLFILFLSISDSSFGLVSWCTNTWHWTPQTLRVLSRVMWSPTCTWRVSKLCQSFSLSALSLIALLPLL